MIQEKIKGIVTSKSNIFSFCIALMPQLVGWKDFFIKIGENLDVVFLVFLSMIVLICIHQFNKIRDKKKISKITVDPAGAIPLIPEKNSTLKFSYSKIIVGISIMLFILSISFLFFLKGATVYYVKISGNLNSTEALAKKQMLKENFIKSGREDFVPTIRRRSIRSQKNNYFLSINGAFLDKRKAEIQMEEIKKILKNKSSIQLSESKNTNITRKIEYLVAHFVPYRILAMF